MIISDFDNLLCIIYGWTFKQFDAKMIIIKEPFKLKHCVCFV